MTTAGLPTDGRGVLVVPGTEVEIPEQLRPWVVVLPEGQHLEFLPTTPAPRNVIEAIARVMDELPGIGKDSKAAPEQGGYAYRGIEAITREAQGLFAKYGVVFAPRVLEHEVQEIVVSNRPWTDTRLLVEYAVYGPGGVEDRITVGPLYALGRDNSDKGANKCMTQAFKYALLQLLCISDAKDDNDSTNAERDQQRSTTPPPPPDPQQQARFDLRTRILTLTPADRDLIRSFCDAAEIPRVTTAMTDEQMELVTAKLDKMAQAPPAETPPEQPAPPAPAAAEQDDLDNVDPEVAAMPIDDVARDLENRLREAGVAEWEPGTPGQLRRRLSSMVRADRELEERDTQGQPPEMLEEILRDVSSMAVRDVDYQLTDVRKIPKAGNVEKRRAALVRVLYRERAHASQPAEQAAE